MMSIQRRLLSCLRTGLILTIAAAALGATSQQAAAHCQVPCGIYDDAARIKAMLEDVATISKATTKINGLADKVKAGDAQALNQSIRWVNTKETHATRIISTVSEYFLTQKLKPADPKDGRAWTQYTRTLAAHHSVMRLAMKAKQGLDTKVVEQLGEAVHALEDYWPKSNKRSRTPHSH